MNAAVRERDLLSRVVHTVAVGVAGALLILAAGCDASHAADARGDSADHASAEHSVPSHDGDGPGMDASDAGHGMDHSAAEHRELAAVAASDFSIYHAGSRWTDQHGEARSLGSLAGRVQVVALVYTNCTYACPRIMLDMKRIEAELGPELADDVGFVIVSIDPERDTPEKLAEFAHGSRLDPGRWTLLHGSPGDIRELAVLLGVQYRETAPGEWVHSNLITVLDRDGVIVHRQLGLGTDPGETLDAIRAAADG